MKEVKKYPNMEGKKAKVFCLPDQNDNKICLKDLLKECKDILLYFYPRDLSEGCTVKAIDFSKAKKKFENKNVKIYGISKFDSKSKRKFIEKNNLTIDLLSDEDFKVSEKYNVWREKNMFGKKVMSIAWETFLISAETGKIIKHWQKVKADVHVETVWEYFKNKK